MYFQPLISLKSTVKSGIDLEKKALLYLQYIPTNEKAIIFGAKWFKTEWNPSKQLVCANGEACLIPFTKLMLFNTLHNFSYACEPAFQIKTNIKMSKH